MKRLMACATFCCALVASVGCAPEGTAATSTTEKAAPVADTKAVATAPPAEEHGHKAGEHGGIIVSIGRDSYHVEAVFEESGKLLLYMLGNDETRVQDVELQDLVAYIKPEGAATATSFTIKPERQPGDAEGKTSLFVGEVPEAHRGQSLEVTVPSLRIGNERFRLGFRSQNASHGDEAMPEKVVDEEEQKLYLTPGGAYTEADIVANGRVTASQKFKGFMSKHDMHPKPGDLICPVTMTKANAKCVWIVGGKEYQFCCPPCVDEFLIQVKKDPATLKQPGEYVKK